MLPTAPSSAAGWLLPAVPLLLGVLLVWKGWRGRRVNDHPVCRRCGFDLHGRPPGSDVCSECGASLLLRRAIRKGARERRPGLVALGVLLVTGAIGWAGAAAWVTFRGLDLNPYKPTWMLAREADSTDPAVQDAALKTLIGRMTDGRLSAADADRLMDRALALQADRSRPWSPLWGDLFLGAVAAGKADADRMQRFAGQALDLHLDVRPRVGRGDRVLPFTLKHLRGRGGSRTPLVATLHAQAPEVDGRALSRLGLLGPVDFGFSGARYVHSQVRLTDKLTLPLPDGTHTLRLPVDVSVTLLPSVPPVNVEQVNVEAQWTLLPAGQETVTRVNDPARREGVQKAVHVRQAAYVEEDDRLALGLIVSSPPVPVGFDVYVRTPRGDEDWVGRFALPAGVSRGFHLNGRWRRFNNPAVDVVLRPSTEAAEATVDVFQIWDGEEIVVRDVKVVQVRGPERRVVP